MEKDPEKKILELAAAAASDYGYELAGVTLFGRGKRALLRVVIDKEGGVSLNDCEIFSRRLESMLDVEDPIAGPFTLEVSSPGLDRPLMKTEDFRKNFGKLVRIITRERIDNQTFFTGRLGEVRDDIISLLTSNGNKPVSIPVNIISKARLEIELK